MRLELNDNKEVVSSDISGVKDSTAEQKVERFDSVAEEIKHQRAKFADLDFKHKLEYISDYYKWKIIIGIIVAIGIAVFIRDFRENMRPDYLTVEFLNSYFSLDADNPIRNDYASQYNVDLETYHLNINTDISLEKDSMDTMNIANQQKLIAMYTSQDIDVVIGTVDIMEGPANCDCYGNLDEILPKDLIDELKDRDYEFYYFDPSKDEIEDDGDVTPYFAGIYLDNCSYLNNIGEFGAYPVATKPEERPIFTIAVNSQNTEHAIEFLRFLIQNR